MSEKARLREFILENFVTGMEPDDLKDDTSFLDEGIIDSTGVLEMVDYLEETYNISVEDEEVLPENFDSIDNLDAYIARKLAGAGVAEPVEAAESREAFKRFDE
jgi:acyl carrier protein